MTDESFANPKYALKLRDIIKNIVDIRIKKTLPLEYTGTILDIKDSNVKNYSTDITVGGVAIPRTLDNPLSGKVAIVRLDSKYDGTEVEARIGPSLIPMFRPAKFFNSNSPSGSGTMVDASGRYVTVGTDAETGESAPTADTYPSLSGTGIIAPQVAPRVSLIASNGIYYVTDLIRGTLASELYREESVSFSGYVGVSDTGTVTWGGSVYFVRSGIVKEYTIATSAPILTIGGTALSVSGSEPVSITLGSRIGSLYVQFSTTDSIPLLIWVEESSNTFTIPNDWYFVFSKIESNILVLANGQRRIPNEQYWGTWAPISTGAVSTHFTASYKHIAAVPYPSIVIVFASCTGTISSSGEWRLWIGWDSTDPGDTSTTQPANSLQSEVYPIHSSSMRMSASVSAFVNLAANQEIWVRAFLYRNAGTFTVEDPYGASMQTLQIPYMEGA